jgi:hypothetical protein
MGVCQRSELDRARNRVAWPLEEHTVDDDQQRIDVPGLGNTSLQAVQRAGRVVTSTDGLAEVRNGLLALARPLEVERA